jgi:hypothetical protein
MHPFEDESEVWFAIEEDGAFHLAGYFQRFYGSVVVAKNEGGNGYVHVTFKLIWPPIRGQINFLTQRSKY